MLGSGIFFAGVMAFGSLIRSADREWMKSVGEKDEDVDGRRVYIYVNEMNEKLRREQII